MILPRHEPKFILPERVETHNNKLAIYPNGDPRAVPNSPAYMIPQASPAEIYNMRADNPELVGRPVLYAIVHNPAGSALHLYPMPDVDYYAVFRYCPAAKEI